MDARKLRRNMLIGLAAVTISSVNATRMLSQNTSLRAVEAVTFIALGLALGASLVNVALYIRARRQ